LRSDTAANATLPGSAALRCHPADEARGELARRLADVIGDVPFLYDGLPAAR
jgi:hypothetical protein